MLHLETLDMIVDHHVEAGHAGLCLGAVVQT